MKITSPGFADKEFIPKKYTCDGENVNPPLIIEDIPSGAESLVLIVDDYDSVKGIWVHWVIFDMPVIKEVRENSAPGRQGINDFGRKNYGGPCPSSGTHRYFFKIYALDAKLNLKEGAGKKEVEQNMQGHIIDSAQLIGLYKR